MQKKAKLGLKVMCDLLLPPLETRGMKILDRDAFAKTVAIPAITIAPGTNLQKIVKLLKPLLLKLQQFKPIEGADDARKILLLNPNLVKNWNDVPKEMEEEFHVSSRDFTQHNVTIQYHNYQLKDLLRSILPANIENVSSFSQIGHIVHVNLKEEVTPFKHIVGQVLLDKVANCKSVVNKVNNINTVYRNFELELLAGEDQFLVVVKENGATFEFDFSKVYWNPRLATEHERLVKMIKKGDVVYDVFAGVGPFSIPLARRSYCKVLANDLNPESVKWLIHNKQKNKIGQNMEIFNKDGKDFILEDIKRDLEKELVMETPKTIQIIMNLPEIGKEFLKYFVGLLEDRTELVNKWNPNVIKIHLNVYMFVRGEDLNETARIDVEDQLNYKLNDTLLSGISFVRNVAPNKDMMRVSFYLNKDMLAGKKAIRKCGEKRTVEELPDDKLAKHFCK